MKPSKIHIGTSGWHYDHWSGPFYPERIAKKEYLRYYADQFHTVEINNSFYRLPGKETLIQWRDSSPSGFIFSVKASRYITHMKKLKDPDEPLQALFDRVNLLANKLGPILFQLPPRWHANLDRLDDFLERLPQGYRYAFEFRDPSWLEPGIYETLARHGAAFCIYEFKGRISQKTVTADFVYIRLHGPEKEAYRGRYDPQTLAGWAGAVSSWSRQGREIFCYFDNDERGFAVQNALELQDMVQKR